MRWIGLSSVCALAVSGCSLGIDRFAFAADAAGGDGGLGANPGQWLGMGGGTGGGTDAGTSDSATPGARAEAGASCPSGYRDSNGDGTSCADQNECDDGSDDCDPDAICINTPGGFRCVECLVPTDCAAPTESCLMATCTEAGECSAEARPVDTPCATGVCDEQGHCLCRGRSDCPNDLDVCVAGSCVPNTCGDGVRAGAEECDDGNTSNDDSCTNACLLAECGDGHVQTGVEECDDGNVSNTDGCTNSCQFARCGDGYIRPVAEACDPAAPGWTDRSCDATDCIAIAYTRCDDNEDCRNGYSCYFGGCAPNCGEICPTLPGFPVAGCGFNSGCQLRCVSGACPAGQVCDDFGQGPTCSMQ